MTCVDFMEPENVAYITFQKSLVALLQLAFISQTNKRIFISLTPCSEGNLVQHDTR